MSRKEIVNRLYEKMRTASELGTRLKGDSTATGSPEYHDLKEFSFALHDCLRSVGAYIEELEQDAAETKEDQPR